MRLKPSCPEFLFRQLKLTEKDENGFYKTFVNLFNTKNNALLSL